jgi:ABC transporter substrate binding protein
MTAARAARAQQKAMPVIGWLYGYSPPANPADLVRGPVHQGLSETGFVEGQNMTSEYRWADFHYDRLPALAADLVSRKVNVIVTGGGAPPALAAKNATSTIPTVFSDVGDPVGLGLVASLAQPGGNLTGVSILTGALTLKRFEMLCELVPQATVIALLVNPDNAGHGEGYIMQEAAREGYKARCPKGQHRSRDRCRLCHHPATASRRAPRRRRCVLLGPARAIRGPGSATRRPGNLLEPGICSGWRPGELWRQHRCSLSPGRRLRRKDP